MRPYAWVGWWMLFGACHHEAVGPTRPAPTLETAPQKDPDPGPATPPPIAAAPMPTCDLVAARLAPEFAKPLADPTPAVAPVEQIVVERCTKDAWSDEARSCIVNSASLTTCLDDLPAAARHALVVDLTALASHRRPELDDAALPRECLAYKQRMETYFQCDKIRAADREAAKQWFTAGWAQWKRYAVGLSPGGLKALGNACQKASDDADANGIVCPP